MEKRIYSLCQSMHDAIDELTTERDAEHLRLCCQCHLFFLPPCWIKSLLSGCEGWKHGPNWMMQKALSTAKQFFSVLRMSKPLSVNSYLKWLRSIISPKKIISMIIQKTWSVREYHRQALQVNQHSATYKDGTVTNTMVKDNSHVNEAVVNLSFKYRK